METSGLKQKSYHKQALESSVLLGGYPCILRIRFDLGFPREDRKYFNKETPILTQGNEVGDFSHLSKTGESQMVDITEKSTSHRRALVTGQVDISQECANKLTSDAIREIISTAKIAGIGAMKQTSQLIPLCHHIPITGINISISFQKEQSAFTIDVDASTNSATGIEMECMTGATIIAVTIYDMIKAINPEASLGPFRLFSKEGGGSGSWKNANLTS